ncbi:MAG TPA: hypothetical protein PLC42_01835 [Parachlamydiaceae bacterium]|nr:hypothetical protein [Parachlamydiaceae bacterium]
MSKLYFCISCLLLSFFPLASNEAKSDALNAIAEFIHPDMAKIWSTFFSNFDQDTILDWNFSERNGRFSFTLKSPMKFFVPASKSATSEPRPGSILIFGLYNKVEGKLNWQKKSIEFSKGFHIFCKYKIGFFTVPIMVDVYNFTYKNSDTIILEAGKGGISEKRGKSLEKYLTAWNDESRVVQGDYEAYLKSQ